MLLTLAVHKNIINHSGHTYEFQIQHNLHARFPVSSHNGSCYEQLLTLDLTKGASCNSCLTFFIHMKHPTDFSRSNSKGCSIRSMKYGY